MKGSDIKKSQNVPESNCKENAHLHNFRAQNTCGTCELRKRRTYYYYYSLMECLGLLSPFLPLKILLVSLILTFSTAVPDCDAV